MRKHKIGDLRIVKEWCGREFDYFVEEYRASETYNSKSQSWLNKLLFGPKIILKPVRWVCVDQSTNIEIAKGLLNLYKEVRDMDKTNKVLYPEEYIEEPLEDNK